MGGCTYSINRIQVAELVYYLAVESPPGVAAVEADEEDEEDDDKLGERDTVEHGEGEQELPGVGGAVRQPGLQQTHQCSDQSGPHLTGSAGAPGCCATDITGTGLVTRPGPLVML